MSGSYADRSAQAYSKGGGQGYGNSGGAPVSYNNSGGAQVSLAYDNRGGGGSGQGFNNSGGVPAYNNNAGQQAYSNNVRAPAHSGGSAQAYINPGGGAQAYNNTGTQGYNNNAAVGAQAYANAGGVAQAYNNNAGVGAQGYNNNNTGGAQAYNVPGGGAQAYNNNTGGAQAYNNNAVGSQGYNNNVGGAQAYNNNAGGAQGYNNNAGGAQGYNNGVGNQGYSSGNTQSQGYNNNNNNNGSAMGYNSQPPPPEAVVAPQPVQPVQPPQPPQQQPPQQQPPQPPQQQPPQPPQQQPPQPPQQQPPPPPITYQQQPPPPPITYQQHQYGSPPPPNTMVGRYQQTQQSYGYANANAIDTEAEEQSRILSKSIARVQESSHYMRQAMERDDLPASLEKARAILTELGDVKTSQLHQQIQQQQTNGPYHDGTTDTVTTQSTTLSPKNYYELHTLALQELPNLEEFFLSLFRQRRYSPSQLYEIVQYCPRAVPRLYLQICVASAWIRTETEAGAAVEGQPPVVAESPLKWLLQDLKGAVRCVQCPIRGLFLRYYLLQALKDKLPDRTEGQRTTAPSEPEPVPVEPRAGTPPVEEEGSFLTNNANLGGLLQNQSPSGGFLDNDGEEKTDNANLGALLHNPSQSGGFLNNEEEIHLKMESINIDASSNPPTAPTPTANPAPPTDPNSATVQDSYEFILSNLIEMNKLWVRIQHMPGDQRTKAARKKRERERNELRVLVGTNIVRLSELNEVTSAIYGTVVLPRILDQIVACRDPLAQAYLMDCMIQVFPDEFHIQTLEVILGVCPRLREKVNIRTIVQGIMDRLSTYYADELLLGDEEDTEGVKTSVMLDTFEMFEDCIASVLEAKASRVTAREVIRLESSLLDFSLKCYPGRTDHVNKCLMVCAAGLRGEMSGESNGPPGGGAAATGRPMPIQLDDVAVVELEKLLSLPLESLALRVLELDHYSELLTFLPFSNRKLVAVNMLKAVESSGQTPMDLNEIEQLFSIVQPLLYREQADQGMGLGLNSPPRAVSDNDELVEHQSLVAKLLHSLYHEDTDFHYDMLCAAKKHLPLSDRACCNYIAPPLVFAALKLLGRIRSSEFPAAPSPPQSVVVESPLEAHVLPEDCVAVDEGNVEAAGESETTIDGGKAVESPQEGSELPEENVAVNEENVEGGESEAAIDDGKADEENEETLDKGTDKAIANEVGEDLPIQNEDVTEEGGEGSETKKNCHDEMKNLIDEEKNEGLFQDDFSNPKPEPVSVFSKQTNCRKVFLFIQRTLAVIKQSCPDTCFTLTLRAAVTADCSAVVANKGGNSSGELNPVTYEFMTQALLLYETGINDSKYQPQAITAIVGTLLSFRSLEHSEYEALITKTTQYAARLLKKTDQCKMVLLCSHLFFIGEEDGAYQNPQRVLECLQRALKIADACTAASASNVQLFVDILEQYVYFYEKNNPIITDRFITGLIALINEHIGNIGTKSASIMNSQCQFYSIIEYIKEKKTQSNSAERFQLIDC